MNCNLYVDVLQRSHFKLRLYEALTGSLLCTLTNRIALNSLCESNDDNKATTGL